MPKIIPNVKETILESAKQLLFKKGFSEFVMREVAESSGVAVGTIYNYFPSKDILVGSIMAKDWMISLKNMENTCKAATSVEEGVRGIYDQILNFIKIYEPIWKEYNGIPSGFNTRHVMLRSQLSDIFIRLLEGLGYRDDVKLSPLITEIILVSAMQDDIDYSILAELTNRIFK